MTEKEKMLAGELYDCGDPELMELWHKGKNLARAYNQLDYADKAGQRRILEALLGSCGENLQITAPFFVDYGCFIHFGNNCEVNMNCVFLDCNEIRLGDNTLIGPGVHVYTVFHPLRAEERFHVHRSGGFPFAIGLTAPVSIGNGVWIGGNCTIMPGVSIGDNVTIGAGSMVTKSLPSNVLALGSPCRVVREL
ncbi:sugar O-acetyltransferase [Desulfovibrio sp. OttesenSCG-928-A18]|nr:sugar O-acetyltransferase [Desulfovibrio sp. OttesenSCG-928-A18]